MRNKYSPAPCPATRQQEFAQRFRALSSVKHRYAAGGRRLCRADAGGQTGS